MSKKEPIKVGVAGAGFIGPAHIEALRRINIPVVGLVTGSREETQQKVAALGIPKGYDSFEDMIADPEITAVHLATPNYLHYPQAKAALLAGKHVICDKPLAMNSRESAELVQLAREKGLVNAICFNLRFYPLMHHARSLIQQGALGDLFILQGSYLQDWLLYPTDWNWRLEPELGGRCAQWPILARIGWIS